MPFQFRYRLNGGAPTIQQIAAGTAGLNLKRGDIVLKDTAGQVSIGVAGSANFLGVCLADYASLTQATSLVSVITDPDAVYEVNDGTARKIGATLDITGTTGAMGVTASSGKEFVVVATKGAATDKTLVRFNVGKHLLNTAV